ncbi:hypothetical protein [Dactylosporangium sp. NPDC051541]|uniref:hypothetical protein n=1 Tax=Dactylosporangium sp. NPDC051541 TaxID=3363977 RepID=UPI0037BD9DB4
MNRHPAGWWRRNAWGLILVFPLLGAALAGPFFQEAKVYLEDPTSPHVPVTAARGGWVTYAAARIRFDELTELTSPADRSGKPVDLAGGKVWQAKVTFDTKEEDGLGGCTVYLEDASARRYSDRPAELTAVNLPTGSAGCTRPVKPGASAPPAGQYQLSFFFLLPRGATPAAVFVGVPTSYPAYAHLPRP